MSDAWGTLAGSGKADGALHGLAAAATDLPPTLAGLGNPGAEGSLAAGTLAATVDPVLVRRYRQAALWCGYFVSAVGCLGLIGWLADVAVLKSISPAWVAMKVNATIGLIAAGSALCLAVAHQGERGLSARISRLCAAFIILLASATLAEDAFGIDFGIDQILQAEPEGAVGTVHLGRMSPLAALNFITFGIALLSMSVARGGRQILSSVLAPLATVVSAVLLLGYLLGAAELYTMSGRVQAIAANASISFFVLGCGVLLANLPSGPLRSLASPYLGGIMLRRMLPGIIVFMTGFVWLRLVAQSLGLFDSVEFGAASVAVAAIICTGGILIWYAGFFDRIDQARRRGDARIIQLNVALNSRVLALEAVNQEYQGLSYSMSHVLRAPLRAIHGFAQIALDEFGDKLGAEGRRLLGVVQSSTGEMSELLDGILDFLRLGWQPMTIVSVDMQQHVRTAIGLLESKTTGRDVRFKIGEIPGARADASMMQRVWLNLLDNAVKFTAGSEAATIEVGARSGIDHTVYFVKDDGAGFDMRYVGKLFGVFQRLHDTTQFHGHRHRTGNRKPRRGPTRWPGMGRRPA